MVDCSTFAGMAGANGILTGIDFTPDGIISPIVNQLLPGLLWHMVVNGLRWKGPSPTAGWQHPAFFI